ncbi:hypothetical protein OG2516_14356 [Oceanicola granulosus HTCC2516]|uniref:Lysozyme inhibitor LprI-like N-terminal domain-containing protein n=1 Tax=Oceanicola granulosus (strain ATCC BAA-861 / DSM 15982 / KCTC 12143 / HTCC2516) TaxID=314256 RepID=Q2CB06_OCEGH|nr:hypothetical protein OG2516_14356 [Oceanicola granulosus HTCC2516]
MGPPALALALLAAAPASAQNCDSAEQTQLEMNNCAAAFYADADADLNAVWPEAMAAARAAGAGDELLAAQRAWLAFRDAACTAEAAIFAGGSIAPMVHADCLTRLTQTRRDDLYAMLMP